VTSFSSLGEVDDQLKPSNPHHRRTQVGVTVLVHWCVQWKCGEEGAFKMEAYLNTMDSIGESILNWADPDNQFRGYTEVCRIAPRRRTTNPIGYAWKYPERPTSRPLQECWMLKCLFLIQIIAFLTRILFSWPARDCIFGSFACVPFTDLR